MNRASHDGIMSASTPFSPHMIFFFPSCRHKNDTKCTVISTVEFPNALLVCSSSSIPFSQIVCYAISFKFLRRLVGDMAISVV